MEKRFYKIEYLISSEAEISFSESCDWKDFLFVGRKVRNYKNHVIPKMKENHYNKIPPLPSYFVKFVLLKETLTINNYREVFELISTQQENFENDRIKIILVNNMGLEQTNQWIQFFRRDLVFNQFLNFSLDYLIKGTDIFAIQRRGFYIYGKDFFFFPNKYWDIIRDNDDSIDVINLDTEEELNIEKEYLNLTLRSPGIHQQYVIPENC